MRVWSLCLVLLVAAFGAQAALSAPEVDLRRGVNTETTWLWHRDTSLWSRGWTPDRLAQMRARGLTHVRLNVSPEPILSSQEPAPLLGDVVGAASAIRAAGLDVVVVLHPDRRLMGDLARAEGVRTRYGTIARDLAGALATAETRGIALELVNEPRRGAGGAGFAWWGYQRSLLAAIRQVAPTLPVVVSGDNWASWRALARLRPLADPNVIYSFHYYDPYWFTHQGATWTGDPMVPYLRRVPYPSTPQETEASVAATRAAAPSPAVADRAEREIRWLLRQRAGAATVQRDLRAIAAWGRRYGVPIYMGEFGVHTAAPRPAAMRWYTDVRQAAERGGIGWSAWFFWAWGGVHPRHPLDGPLAFHRPY